MNVESLVADLIKIAVRLIANKLLSDSDQAAAWDLLALRAKAKAQLAARKAKLAQR